MRAVRAARYDISVEQGGAWRRSVRRNSLDGPMPLTAPCGLDIYPTSPSASSDPTPVTSLTGTIATDTYSVEYAMTSQQTQALVPGIYTYRVTVGDPVLADVIVLLRGYLTVIGGVSG